MLNDKIVVGGRVTNIRQVTDISGTSMNPYLWTYMGMGWIVSRGYGFANYVRLIDIPKPETIMLDDMVQHDP